MGDDEGSGVGLGGFFDSVPTESKPSEDNYSYQSSDVSVSDDRENISEIAADISGRRRSFAFSTPNRTKKRRANVRDVDRFMWPKRALAVAAVVIILAFAYEAIFVLHLK